VAGLGLIEMTLMAQQYGQQVAWEIGARQETGTGLKATHIAQLIKHRLLHAPLGQRAINILRPRTRMACGGEKMNTGASNPIKAYIIPSVNGYHS